MVYFMSHSKFLILLNVSAASENIRLAFCFVFLAISHIEPSLSSFQLHCGKLPGTRLELFLLLLDKKEKE